MGLLDNIKGVIGDEGMNLFETASKGAISGVSKAAIDAVSSPNLAPPTTEPVDLMPPQADERVSSDANEGTNVPSKTASNQDSISKLFRLQEMLESGLITESEFQSLKKQLFT